MKVIFLGPPGAGKGTQAKKVAEELSIPHISTGDMLRAAVQAETPLGLEIKQVMESGQLVPDDTIVRLIEQRVSEPDCAKGYILDGFPRTLPQAESLAKMLADRGESIDVALLFNVPAEEVLRRMESRRATEGRADDSSDTQRERLKVYEAQTAPLIEYYTKLDLLREVSGVGSIDEIEMRVLNALKG